MATTRYIDIKVRSKKAQAGVKSLTNDVEKLGDETKKTTSRFGSLSKVAIGVGKATAAAIGTAAASMVALSKVVADYSKEIKVASQLSGVTVEQLQLMAHATSTVGIGIEDLGDKFKDTREKIGDFLNTGGGGFQDFVDALRLTKEEARKVAVEFSTLSGDQILQKMVNRMEAAGVSAVQMSHALEGMASDTTKLIPLLSNGGSEMKRLTDNMSRLVVPLSDDDIDLFIRMGESTDIAAGALKSLGEQILVDLGEHFIEAANKASFFYASLNEGTEAQKTTRLVQIVDEIDALEDKISKFNNGLNRFLRSDEELDRLVVKTTKEVNDLLAERIQLQKDLAKTSLGIGESKPKSIPKASGTDAAVTPNADENKKALDALIQRFKSEESLLTEKLAKDLSLAEGNNELKLKVQEEFNKSLAELNSSSAVEEAQGSGLSGRLSQETEMLQRELNSRNAIMFGFVGEQEAALSLSFLNKQARSTAAFDAEIIKLGDNEAAKVELRLQFQESQKLEEQLFQQDLTAIQEEESQKRIDQNQKEADSQKQSLSSQLATTGFILNSLASLSDKNQKRNEKIQKAAIIANTASAVIQSYNNSGGYPWGIASAVAMAAAGAAQLAKVGSGGGGSISAPSVSASTSQLSASTPAVTQDFTSNDVVENKALTDLTNELANRDPDEMLPVSWVRRLTASIENVQSSGQV